MSGSGIVKYSSGEPVPTGVVFFETPEFSYTGQINNGAFTLEGAPGKGIPPGTYNVSANGMDPVTDKPLIAAKFSDPKTSGLVCEIKAGDKNFFEIVVDKAE